MGKPHPVDGDLPLAFVVKKPNNENVTEAEIIEYVDRKYQFLIQPKKILNMYYCVHFFRPCCRFAKTSRRCDIP